MVVAVTGEVNCLRAMGFGSMASLSLAVASRFAVCSGYG